VCQAERETTALGTLWPCLEKFKLRSELLVGGPSREFHFESLSTAEAFTAQPSAIVDRSDIREAGRRYREVEGNQDGWAGS
jgi:hypothetical protein